MEEECAISLRLFPWYCFGMADTHYTMASRCTKVRSLSWHHGSIGLTRTAFQRKNGPPTDSFLAPTHLTTPPITYRLRMSSYQNRSLQMQKITTRIEKKSGAMEVERQRNLLQWKSNLTSSKKSTTMVRSTRHDISRRTLIL